MNTVQELALFVSRYASLDLSSAVAAVASAFAGIDARGFYAFEHGRVVLCLELGGFPCELYVGADSVAVRVRGEAYSVGTAEQAAVRVLRAFAGWRESGAPALRPFHCANSNFSATAEDKEEARAALLGVFRKGC